MASRYYITTTGTTTGSKLLPVGSGEKTYMSAAMGDTSNRIDCYLEFYNSSGAPVTPTGGQIYFSGLPMTNNWVNAVGSPVDATTVSAMLSTYVPPYMDGLALFARVKFINIVGAAFASVVLYKREAS